MPSHKSPLMFYKPVASDPKSDAAFHKVVAELLGLQNSDYNHNHTPSPKVVFKPFIGDALFASKSFKSASYAVTKDVRTEPSPSIAKPSFHWDGSFRNVVFVASTAPSECLSGDERLRIDLGAKLAQAMDIKPRYIGPADIDRIQHELGNPIFLAINCHITAPSLSKADALFSLVISNDLSQHEDYHDTDFRFEAPFNNPASRHPAKQIVFNTTTLPSRITPEIIAEAASKNPALKTDGKPLIAIMFRKQMGHEIKQMAETAKFLADSHGARFVLCGGPRTKITSFSSAVQLFESIPGTLPYWWDQKPNPYLAILGAATHFVTSGTLSTTCDLLATAKPVYYHTDNPGSNGCDYSLKTHLFREKAVQLFSDKMLDTPPPDLAIRTRYAQEWDRVSAEFVCAFTQLLHDRFGPASPGSTHAHTKSGVAHG